MIADKNGLKDGKHAVRIPIFVSTAERAAAGGLSNVGSVEFEMATSE